MAASSPAKRAPRKATRAPEERAEQHQQQFEAFRDRARQLKFHGRRVNIDPYVIAAGDLDDGITTDAVFRLPETLAARTKMTQFTSMLRRGEVDVLPEVMIGYSDPYTFERVLRWFDRVDADDPDSLLFGLAITIIEHFSGPGASDVPGGSTGS